MASSRKVDIRQRRARWGRKLFEWRIIPSAVSSSCDNNFSDILTKEKALTSQTHVSLSRVVTSQNLEGGCMLTKWPK